MQKDEFYKYAEHPELLDKESIALLNELVNTFPYFQTARLLLTKALHEQKNFYFDSQLKITASYFADRKRLHQFINYKPLANKSVDALPETTPIIYDKFEETIIKEEIAPVFENNTPIYKESLEETILANNAIIEVEEEVVLENNSIIEVEEEVVLENNAIIEVEKEEILESNEIPEAKEESLLEILASIKKSEPKPEETVIESVFETNNIEAIEEIPANEPPIEEEKVLDKASKHSFSEWLKELNKGANALKKPDFQEKELVNEKNLEPKKKDIQEEIIEKFITTNPVIPPPKKEFYSPVNMAKLSIMENDDLCSETLAKIYFDQGNFARSKSMYEKLSLKYPQKSVYFAARIKEINDIINK